MLGRPSYDDDEVRERKEIEEREKRERKEIMETDMQDRQSRMMFEGHCVSLLFFSHPRAAMLNSFVK